MRTLVLAIAICILVTLAPSARADDAWTGNIVEEDDFWTPDNRVYYGRGEEITFTLKVRCPDADKPMTVQLRLLDGKRTVAEGEATVVISTSVQ